MNTFVQGSSRELHGPGCDEAGPDGGGAVPDDVPGPTHPQSAGDIRRSLQPRLPSSQVLQRHCTQYTVHSTLYTVHCTQYTVHCTLYTVPQDWSVNCKRTVYCIVLYCTLYAVQCTQYCVYFTELYTLYTVQCAVHTVRCTQYGCTLLCTLH